MMFKKYLSVIIEISPTKEVKLITLYYFQWSMVRNLSHLKATFPDSHLFCLSFKQADKKWILVCLETCSFIHSLVQIMKDVKEHSSKKDYSKSYDLSGSVVVVSVGSDFESSANNLLR